MRKLDNEVSINGHKYELYLRDENIVVYKQFDKKTDVLVGYEVFEVQVRPEEVFNGTVIPEREVFPSTTNWGLTAWTLRSTCTHEDILKRVETVKGLSNARQERKQHSSNKTNR